MGEEKPQPKPPPQKGKQDTSAPDKPPSPNGQPAYKPRPIDPKLWHWVEKREAAPGEAKRQK